jgi:hypothetical protein
MPSTTCSPSASTALKAGAGRAIAPPRRAARPAIPEGTEDSRHPVDELHQCPHSRTSCARPAAELSERIGRQNPPAISGQSMKLRPHRCPPPARPAGSARRRHAPDRCPMNRPERASPARRACIKSRSVAAQPRHTRRSARGSRRPAPDGGQPVGGHIQHRARQARRHHPPADRPCSPPSTPKPTGAASSRRNLARQQNPKNPTAQTSPITRPSCRWPHSHQ